MSSVTGTGTGGKAGSQPFRRAAPARRRRDPSPPPKPNAPPPEEKKAGVAAVAAAAAVLPTPTRLTILLDVLSTVPKTVAQLIDDYTRRSQSDKMVQYDLCRAMVAPPCPSAAREQEFPRMGRFVSISQRVRALAFNNLFDLQCTLGLVFTGFESTDLCKCS
jgi:hypothetical protein